MGFEYIGKFVDLLRKDKVLGEPTRLSIMILLYLNIRMKFTDLQRILGLTPGNLASHLKRLKEAGYITIRKTFLLELRTTTVVEITRSGAKSLLDFIGGLEAILEPVRSKLLDKKDMNG